MLTVTGSCAIIRSLAFHFAAFGIVCYGIAAAHAQCKPAVDWHAGPEPRLCLIIVKCDCAPTTAQMSAAINWARVRCQPCVGRPFSSPGGSLHGLPFRTLRRCSALFPGHRLLSGLRLTLRDVRLLGSCWQLRSSGWCSGPNLRSVEIKHS